MRILPKHNRGFTLFEAIAAIAILGISGLALFASLQGGLRLVTDTRENIIAGSIIQEEMEALRKAPFVSLPSIGSSTFSNSSLSLLHNSSGSFYVDQYIDDKILRVTISVVWYSRLNTSKQNTQSIVMLIVKNGINHG